MKTISILLPSYNEEEQIDITLTEVPKYIPDHYDYRLLFIDDGSSDKTWELLTEASRKDDRIQALRFSRNFGKEAALVAGLLQAEGDAVIVMDCDLQHPPRYLPQMLELWEEGYEVVEAVKESRQKESALNRKSANMFYKLFKRFTGIDIANASDFKLLDRKVVEIWRQMPERANFFRAQSAWLGFKRKSFVFEVDDRITGETRWSTGQLIRLALDAITSFSAKPLLFIALIGVIFILVFIFLGIHTLINWLRGTAATGFTTVILLQLLIGGSILFSLGLMGIYLEKIFNEVKGRPRYIVTEKIGFTANAKPGIGSNDSAYVGPKDLDIET